MMTTRNQLIGKLLLIFSITIFALGLVSIYNVNANIIGEGHKQESTPSVNEIETNFVFLPIVIVPLPNAAPTNIALSAASIQENKPVNTTVGTFSTTDPDAGNTFTYTLVTGTGSTDNASFNISGNALRNSAVFNYEVKNSYSIRVRTTDQGGLYFEKVFTITVTNVNETPTNIALSATSIQENKPVNTTVGTFTTTDPDTGNTFTYTLVTGTGSTDNASFNISGNALRNSVVFNYEVKNSYSIRVRTTDQGGLYFEKVFTITVTNVNDAPTNITLSNATIQENKPINTEIGTFSATDQDAGNTFTYTLVSGTGSTDNASFNISVNKLRNSAVFNYEVKNSYSIRVRTTDQGGLYFEKVFTITVTNVNETPTNIALSATSIPENKPVNTTVGTFSTTDPDAGNTFTYTLVTGTGSTDNASFNISGNALRNSVVFNYETKNSYSIRVRTTDQGGLYFEKAFTISVTDVYEDPPGVTIRPNHSWYVDSIDYLHIVGVVKNNTSANLRFVKVYVNIFNSSGVLLDTDYTYTLPDNIPAWQTGCFHLFVSLPLGWSYYTFEPVDYWTDGIPAPNLTAYNHSGSYNTDYGWYEILGMVRNDSNVTYTWIKSIATLYNAAGTVIGCDSTYPNTYTLSPGQSSAFELTFTGRDYSDASYYTIKVDGDVQ